MLNKNTKKKWIYEIDIFNKVNGNKIRTLTFTDREQAYNQLDFYNLTINLRATIKHIYK